jgi:hypothetical protein
MGASYLTMVVHDLTKMKAVRSAPCLAVANVFARSLSMCNPFCGTQVKETLAAKYPELNEESLTGASELLKSSTARRCCQQCRPRPVRNIWDIYIWERCIVVSCHILNPGAIHTPYTRS